MFSMCSELTPRARIPDTRIPQLMQPWVLQFNRYSWMGDSNSKNAKIKVQMISKPRRSCPGALAHPNGWCRKFSHSPNSSPSKLAWCIFSSDSSPIIVQCTPLTMIQSVEGGKGRGALCSNIPMLIFKIYIWTFFSAKSVSHRNHFI